jgi:hypothetical protein
VLQACNAEQQLQITPKPILSDVFIALCRELGKVVTGKLVVITPDRQDVFLVKGRQPAYVPPQTSDLPSGTYLAGTTASSRAKGSSSSSQKSLRAGAAAEAGVQQAASSSSGAGAGSQQQRPKVNYLQQNIKRAAAAAAKKTDRRV